MLAAVGGFHFAPIRLDINPGRERAGVTVSDVADDAGCDADRTRSVEVLRWSGCRFTEVLKLGEISSCCDPVSLARSTETLVLTSTIGVGAATASTGVGLLSLTSASLLLVHPLASDLNPPSPGTSDSAALVLPPIMTARLILSPELSTPDVPPPEGEYPPEFCAELVPPLEATDP